MLGADGLREGEGVKLVDMSPSLQARVRASIAKEAARTRARPSDAPTVTLGGKKRASKAKDSGPNATEDEYNDRFLDGKGVYEAITLRLPGGSRYTPDWMSVEHVGFDFDGVKQSVVTLTEVKGSHRFPSEGRSRLAFDVAKKEFPMFRFVWAKKTKSGEWEFK